MKMLIIAGHGDGDPGACAFGYEEATLVREAAELLKTSISNYENVNVSVADTSRDWYKYLYHGGKYDFKTYDYVLELHFNGLKNTAKENDVTTGTEIYVTHYEKSSVVEQYIVNGIAGLGFKNRGVKRHNYTVITKVRNQGVSSALLEICFINDEDDIKLYQAKKVEVIEAIAGGVALGFGLKKKEEKIMAKFTDTAGHWAEKPIDELFEMGVINGNGDDTYSPDEPITKAQVAVIARNVIRYITGK